MPISRRFNPRALKKNYQNNALPPLAVVSPSRREFLGMAGVGLPSVLRQDMPFKVQANGKAVSILLGDRAAWVVDPKRFSGSPELDVREQKQRIDIHLRNAFFPGTELPASFRGSIADDGAGWQLSLNFECDLRLEARLMDWLAGYTSAEGRWTQSELAFCPDLRLYFPNTATVRFRPDWSLDFNGIVEVSIDSFGPLQAAGARISLNAGEPLASQPLVRRTLLSIDRGRSHWEIDVTQQAENAWAIQHDDNLFDHLTVEAGETEDRRIYTGLLSQAAKNAAQLRFLPSPDLKDETGDPFFLHLTAPRLALSFGEMPQTSGLIADFFPETKWLEAHGIRVLVGADADTEPFELLRKGAATEALNATPQLFDVSLPGEEDICSNLKFHDRRGIQFTWANLVQPIERGLATLHLMPWEHGVRIDLQHTTLSVLRPADLLKLDFTFEHLQLSTWFGARLEPVDRQDPAKLPVITVTFPGQNIAEEAFLEQPPGFQLKDFVLPEKNLNRGDFSAPVWQQKRLYEPDLPVNPPTGQTIYNTDAPAWPVRARFAEPSRLVFQLSKAEHIPFRLSALLDWSKWNLKVHPVALSAQEAVDLYKTGGAKPDLPTADPVGYTSIEMPYRLMISPPMASTWVHSPKPVQRAGFTELWHTRLATLVAREGKRTIDENDAAHRTIRAIWSPDYQKASDPWPAHDRFPFRMSLDKQDRHEIVHLTSNYQIPNQANCDSGSTPFIPGAVQVDQMMLSSLGGWLKSRGTWEPPIVAPPNSKILTVEEWRHSAAMGRDHYVKIVYKGYLMPFGHRASLIKVTERKFEPIVDSTVDPPISSWGAPLRQRFYIIVREPRKEFPAYGMTPAMTRRFHYSAVEAVTLVTPSLADPTSEVGSEISHFWPTIGPKMPFFFHFRLYGEHGITDCSMPVLFVDNSVAYESQKSADARKQYNGEPTGRQVVSFGGQRIAFAPENQPGDTEYNTNRIRFEVDFTDPFDNSKFPCLYSKGQPAFYPKQARMDLNPEGVRRIAGKDLDVSVRFVDRYVNTGFDPVQNSGEVFLEILGPDLKTPGNLDLSFTGGQNGAQSGAVVSPNLGIVGFSRKNGSVGGGGRAEQSAGALNATLISGSPHSALDKVATGEFDPLDFFGGALSQAKILGAVSLWDIVKPLAAGALSNLDEAPKMLEQTLFPLIQDVVKLESDVVTLLGSLPEFVQKQLGAEIQAVRDNLARVRASPSDILLQAPFIRSLAQVGDKIRALLNDPSKLLDPALQQLTKWKNDLEAALASRVSAMLQPWKDVYDQVLQKLTDTLTGWVLTALVYQEQIDTYRTEIKSQVQAVQSQLRSLISLVADSTKTPLTLDLTKLSQALAAQIPALGQLADLQKRVAALIELAKKVNPDIAGLLGGLSDVQKWALSVNAAQAERDVQNFESQTQIWIAALPDGPILRTAEQLVRQAAGAMRTGIQKTGQTAVADLKKIQDTHKQLLTSLQQLQALVLQQSGGASIVAAAATPNPQADLLKLFNEAANKFSIVQQALSAGNLETKLSLFLSLLPASAQADLAALTSRITNLRTAITAADEQAKYKLLSSYLQLFNLWQQYQEPFKLAADVLGLSASDLKNLRDLEVQYNKILTLAQAVQKNLRDLQTDYGALVQALPSLAQALLGALTKNATDTIASVVNETIQEKLLPLEQQAIQALTDLYFDILRRAERPLDGLQDLAKAKDTVEALVKQFGLPQSVTISYTWNPVIKSLEPVFQVNKDGTLSINAAVTTFFNGTAPQFAIDGKLTNFTINLIGSPQFIGIVFDYLNFSSHSGSQPDCKVHINKVELSEALNFVKKLESLLSPKDGPFLELTFDGILAGFRFAIPTISVGAFSLQNLRLIVAVNLPFSGDPMRCEFGVSERDNPFLLSVGIFGGGGFFHMRLGLDGVELLEGALEFGVVAEISIGIATGGGYIMAGIYFSASKTEALVCGFVHANGHLDVLGLISMDIDAFVQVCYVKRGNQTFAEGEARIIVHIEILFFSEDVELHAHYQFAGSNSDSSGQGGPPAMANPRLRPLGPAQPSTVERTLDPPRASGDYCDLGSSSEWNKYRRAFAW